MQYITSVGEILIDFVPTQALKLGEACYTPFPGGAPANVAVAVARLNGTSRFIGKLSEDTLGQLLKDCLQADGVDTRFVSTTPAPTAMTIVSLQENGQRSFTFFRDGTADMQLEVRDLEAADWHETAICHVGSVLLSADPSRTATLASVDYARATGALISFDVNMRPALWKSFDEFRTILTTLLPKVDFLKFSLEDLEYMDSGLKVEAGPLAQEDLFALGQRFLALGPKLVAITLGEEGALLMTQAHRTRSSAEAVRAIDTTGAGDAFTGALLTGLAQLGFTDPAKLSLLTEEDIQRLGSFANRAAALSCTRRGGIASLPYAGEIAPL